MSQDSQDKTEATRELTPLVFQLRELVKLDSDMPVNLAKTQSSCGGEDTYQ